MTKWNLHLLTRIQINYLTLEILNKVLIKLRLFKKRRRKKYKKLMFRMIKLISRHKSKDQHMEVSNTPIKLNIKTVRLCNCKKKEIILKYKIKESIFLFNIQKRFRILLRGLTVTCLSVPYCFFRNILNFRESFFRTVKSPKF